MLLYNCDFIKFKAPHRAQHEEYVANRAAAQLTGERLHFVEALGLCLFAMYSHRDGLQSALAVPTRPVLSHPVAAASSCHQRLLL